MLGRKSGGNSLSMNRDWGNLPRTSFKFMALLLCACRLQEVELSLICSSRMSVDESCVPYLEHTD